MRALHSLTALCTRWLRPTWFGGRPQRRRRTIPFVPSPLESRILLASRTWDGGAILNDKWTDEKNWVDDVKPVAGDTLIFPARVDDVEINPTDFSMVNDFPAGTLFESISFQRQGYSVTGNAIQLRSGINVLSVAGLSQSLTIFEPDIQIAANSTGLIIRTANERVTQAFPETILHLKGKISGPAGIGVTFTGRTGEPNGGTVFLTGSKSNTYTGPTIVEKGVDLGVARTAGTTSIPGNLIVRQQEGTTGNLENGRGRVFLHNSNQIKDTAVVTVQDGATFQYLSTSLTETVASIAFQGTGSKIIGGGTLRLNGDVVFPAIAGEATPPSTLGATIEMASLFRTGKVNWRFDIGANRSLEVNGALGGDVALFKLGAGSLRTRGSQRNVYTGTTVVQAGALSSSKPAGVISIPANLTIGNAAAAPHSATAASFTYGNSEQIANTAVVTILGDGRLNATGGAAQEDVFFQLTMNGGILQATGKIKPTKVVVSPTPLGVKLNSTNLPVIVGGVPANYDIGNGPAPIDVTMDLIPGLGGNGSWAKRGLGTMLISADDLDAQQTIFVENGVLILGGVSRNLTNVEVRGGTLRLNGVILAGLNVAFGRVELDDFAATIQGGGDILAGQEGRFVVKFEANGAGSVGYRSSGNVVLGVLGSADRFPILDLQPENPIPLGTKVVVFRPGTNKTVTGLLRSPDGTVLNEGATFVAGGQSFTITYRGGVNANEVVATRNSGPAFVNRSFPQTAVEGETVTLRGTITEPDTGDTFFLDVNWGDGQTQTITVAPGSSPLVSVDHRYLQDGRFTVKMVWRDQHGGQNKAEHRITVKNAAPVLRNLAVTTPIVRGGTATLTGILTDAGERDNLTLTITWGDRSQKVTVTPSADGTFTLSHLFSRRGRYRITLVASDGQTRVTQRLILQVQ
jgi:autotransporter-associated beta strand protein